MVETDDDLPSDYDLIIVGTGMTESIVAAAASRIGKKTLHIDSTDYYGGMWASFNFDGLQKFIADTCQSAINQNFTLKNVQQEWFIQESVNENNSENPQKDIETTQSNEKDSENVTNPSNASESEKKESTEKTSADSPKVWTVQGIKNEYRKFNIDLAPKLLFARGALVELLISSNIARYAEFRCINRVMTWIHDQPVPVPCSRADVFSTADVSVVEKRMLMKLLTSFINYDDNSLENEFKDCTNKTFKEFLKGKRLTDNLVHYVLYAIAGGTDSTACMDGVLRCRRFLTSLGRYGNTPFLWPMYGSGELPQCFCRLCAVFGGIYCLKRPIGVIEVVNASEDDKRPISIESNGKVLKCDHLVIAIDKVPTEYLNDCDSNIVGLSRAVFITDSSILDFEKESLTLLQFPPMDGNKDTVTVIEVGPSTGSCPQGLYIVHMICSQNKTAKDDILPYAKKLMSIDENTNGDENIGRPRVLWSLYFNIPDTSHSDMCKSKDERIHICSGPDGDLDFEFAVKQGRDIFQKIYPNEEFLPRAPDPEEIVFEGDDETGPEFEKDSSEKTETKIVEKSPDETENA